MNDYEKYQQALREEEESPPTAEQLASLRPVKVKVAKDPRAVFSIRLSLEELRAITAAAGDRPISEFVRSAAVKAARESQGYDRAVGHLMAAQELLQSAIREVGGEKAPRGRRRRTGYEPGTVPS